MDKQEAYLTVFNISCFQARNKLTQEMCIGLSILSHNWSIVQHFKTGF